MRVHEILKNEQYTGTYIAGKTFQDRDGKKYHTPKSEWIVIADKHPPIISKEMFDEVQKIRAKSRKNMRRRDYLLHGKVSCGCCGYSLVYGHTTTPAMYRCMHTHADKAAECHKMKVNAPKLENAIMTIIKRQAELVLESSDLSELCKMNTGKKWTSECEKQIRQCVEQRQKYYEQFIQGEIDRDVFNILKNECTAQLDKLNNRVALYKQEERDKQANKKVSTLAKEALCETANPQDIVNALVDKVLVFPNDRIEIQWKFVNFAVGNL